MRCFQRHEAKESPFSRFWRVGASAILLLLTAAAAQAAPKPRVAVLRFEFQGKVSELGRLSLSQRLVEGLAAAGFQVSAGNVLRSVVKSVPTADKCRDAACYRQVAENLGVDYLVVGIIQVNQKTYDIKLELITGREGKSLGEEREKCEICGIDEVGTKLDRVASSLIGFVEGQGAGPARITVESQPSGADVAVDGRAAGMTPVSLELPAGDHEIVLTASGHVKARQKIRAEAGMSEVVSVYMLPLPTSTESGRRWRRLGWGGVIAGGMAIVGGAVALAFDGRKVTCSSLVERARGSTCHINTGLLAGSLLGAGAIAASMGGLLLYFEPIDGIMPADIAAIGSGSVFVAGRF